MKEIVIAALSINALFSVSAYAAAKCDVPVAEWQPREALEAQLTSQGWQVRTIKTEDGCYEVYAIDAKGEKIEAYFNPKTFEPAGGEEDDG